MNDNELLEKIFIAISEKLLADLLQEEFTYRQINFNNQHEPQDFEAGTMHVNQVFRGLRLRTLIGENEYRTDSEHRFDCVIQSNDVYYAAELKAGQSGPAADFRAFAAYCREKRVRFRENKSQYLDGCISAFLSKFTHIEEELLIYSESPEQNNRYPINEVWFLCFRRRPEQLEIPNIGTSTRETFYRTFVNCRILFLDDLIRARHQTLDNFRKTMELVLSLDTHGRVAEYIWNSLNL